MTKQNKEALDKMEGIFQIYEGMSSVKPTAAELNEMGRIYKEEFNIHANLWCTSCVIEMIRVLNNLRKGLTKSINNPQ